MAYTITESKPVGSGKNLCNIFIEGIAALTEIPKTISDNFAIGSVAYTPSLEIYFLTSNGWELSG